MSVVIKKKDPLTDFVLDEIYVDDLVKLQQLVSNPKNM